MFTGRPSPGDFVRRISRPGDTWLVLGGGLACMLAVGLYFGSMLAHPGHALINWYDFRVYWDGGLVARRSPEAVYSWQFGPEARFGYTLDPEAGFTYTPFAAALFALMSLMSWTAAKWLMTGASLAALVATVSMTLRQLGWAGWRRPGAVLLLAAVAFWFEPVQRALHLGQVELILMTLIVWDLGQPSRRWWQGAGIGLAAGIKLVPLIFIPYLLVTRKFRQAGVAVAVLAATMTAGFVVLPRASKQWWLTGYFLDTRPDWGHGVIGESVAARPADPRWPQRGRPRRPGRWPSRSWPGDRGRGDRPAGRGGLLPVRTAGPRLGDVRPDRLLVSPISWDHHWVWMVPALVLLADAALRARQSRRRALWTAAAALVAVFSDWPGEITGEGLLTPRGVYGPELFHWHGPDVVVQNAYVLAGLVLFAAMIAAALVARRSRALPPLGRWLEEPSASSPQAGVDQELVRD